MTAPERVRPGTAEQLARLSHFASLDLPEVDELDAVSRFLVGRVGDAGEVLEHLGDELERLWSLITDDWSESHLDELTDEDWERHSFATQQQEIDHRHSATVARLVHDIEGHIQLARLVHAEEIRPVRSAVAS